MNRRRAVFRGEPWSSGVLPRTTKSTKERGRRLPAARPSSSKPLAAHATTACPTRKTGDPWKRRVIGCLAGAPRNLRPHPRRRRLLHTLPARVPELMPTPSEEPTSRQHYRPRRCRTVGNERWCEKTDVPTFFATQGIANAPQSQAWRRQTPKAAAHVSGQAFKSLASMRWTPFASWPRSAICAPRISVVLYGQVPALQSAEVRWRDGPSPA